MFSTRTPNDLAPNLLAQALERLRAAGRPILDLTGSNPTQAGFDYPPDLLAPLAHPRGLVYAPQPFGAWEARRAVAQELGRNVTEVSPDRVVLTASTSESYSLLFKLLADHGDEVLVPRPSYPLFDHLTRLELVVPRSYELEYHGTWSIDFPSVERAWTTRTRAVLVVSPNNPTGSFIKHAEFDRLAAWCAERDAALIVDEVFADYEIEPGSKAGAGHPVNEHRALTFSLGGLSKSAGLPQIKLGWMVAAGPPAVVAAALDRLELVCDTYLSVSTPVQESAAELFRASVGVRRQIAERIERNYRALRDVTETTPCRVLRTEGGWYAVTQVPTLGSEEQLVLELLTSCEVLAHPGYFFDFPHESFLVVSLLTGEDILAEGVRRILRHFGCSPSAHV